MRIPVSYTHLAFDEGLIRRTFGVKIEETDLKVVFDKMAELPEESWKVDMEKMEKTYNMDTLPDGHLENHSKL